MKSPGSIPFGRRQPSWSRTFRAKRFGEGRPDGPAVWRKSGHGGGQGEGVPHRGCGAGRLLPASIPGAAVPATRKRARNLAQGPVASSGDSGSSLWTPLVATREMPNSRGCLVVWARPASTGMTGNPWFRHVQRAQQQPRGLIAPQASSTSTSRHTGRQSRCPSASWRSCHWLTGEMDGFLTPATDAPGTAPRTATLRPPPLASALAWRGLSVRRMAGEDGARVEAVVVRADRDGLDGFAPAHGEELQQRCLAGARCALYDLCGAGGRRRALPKPSLVDRGALRLNFPERLVAAHEEWRQLPVPAFAEPPKPFRSEARGRCRVRPHMAWIVAGARQALHATKALPAGLLRRRLLGVRSALDRALRWGSCVCRAGVARVHNCPNTWLSCADAPVT